MTNYAAIANLAAGLSSVAGGITANVQSASQAKTAAREAEERALLNDDEVRSFAANQAVTFLSSGVELEGSPLIVLNDTIRKGFDQSEDIRRAGASQSRAISDTGRNALLSGVITGASLASKSLSATAGITAKAKKNDIGGN